MSDPAPPSQCTVIRPHSVSLQIIQREKCQYRNEVLGLPNFVGFVKDQTTKGKVTRKAA